MYLGAIGDTDLYEALASWWQDLAGVEPVLSAPPLVEVAERRQGERRLLFVLNHTGQSQEVTLHGRFKDLLDGERLLEGKATIGPLDVLVLEESDG